MAVWFHVDWKYIQWWSYIHVRLKMYFRPYVRGYGQCYLSNLRKFRPSGKMYLRYKSVNIYRRECDGWVSKTAALYLKRPGFRRWEWLSWFVLCFPPNKCWNKYMTLFSFRIISYYLFTNHTTIRGYIFDILTALLSKPQGCLKASFKTSVVPPSGSWS